MKDKIDIEIKEKKKQIAPLGLFGICVLAIIGASLGAWVSTFHLFASFWIWGMRILCVVLYLFIRGSWGALSVKTVVKTMDIRIHQVIYAIVLIFFCFSCALRT